MMAVSYLFESFLFTDMHTNALFPEQGRNQEDSSVQLQTSSIPYSAQKVNSLSLFCSIMFPIHFFCPLDFLGCIVCQTLVLPPLNRLVSDQAYKQSTFYATVVFGLNRVQLPCTPVLIGFSLVSIIKIEQPNKRSLVMFSDRFLEEKCKKSSHR